MTVQQPESDQVRAAWDSIAPRFDQYITPTATRNAALALDRIDLRDGSRLLDVACGSGALAIPAARRGAEVIAVDISPRMIDLLDARARTEGVAVDGRVMDAHDLQLPDAGVDFAVSQNGVTMSPMLSRALVEMVRVTRPGGKVLVAAFGALPEVEFLGMFFAGVRAAVPDFAGLPTDPPPPPFRVAAPAALSRALEGSGLHEVIVHPVTWDQPVASAAELWDDVTASNPLGAQAVAGLGERQKADVLTVLDGMLRERFGGRGEGVLRAAVNVAVGTV